jgi:soluble lytic murein transglycosylase
VKDRNTNRVDNKTAAELAYLAGRYHRSISYAERLPAADPLRLGLMYPAGFHALICREAAKYDVDPLWLHAIIWQESKYNPRARSAASARGVMQFIPETANVEGAAIGLKEFSLEQLYDPSINISMGAHYFASLLKELKNPLLALAAYNGGIDNARRWKTKYAGGDDDMFVADIGFAETKRYVMAVYGARTAYQSLR